VPTIAWSSPKSSPTGEGPVTIMASRLELRRLREVPSFLAAAMRVRRQMLTSPGSMGVSLVAKPLQRTFWTLSAWQGEADLRRTVGMEPHVGVMKHFRPCMARSAFVTWRAEASDLPVPWNEALRRLEKPDTVRAHREDKP
jgi:hypothetical protein